MRMRCMKSMFSRKKNQLRIKYARTVSFATDIKLFFLTVFKTIKKALTFMTK